MKKIRSIWVICFCIYVCSIIYILNLIDWGKYISKGSIIAVIEGLLCAIIIIIPLVDLLFHIIKKRKFSYTIQRKALKVMSYYILLIIIGTSTTCIFEIIFDYVDKYGECTYYLYEYKEKKNDSEYKVIRYQNNTFLQIKKFSYFKNDTMFKNDKFTEEFIELFNRIIKNGSDDNIKKVISIDWDNMELFE